MWYINHMKRRCFQAVQRNMSLEMFKTDLFERKKQDRRFCPSAERVSTIQHHQRECHSVKSQRCDQRQCRGRRLEDGRLASCAHSRAGTRDDARKHRVSRRAACLVLDISCRWSASAVVHDNERIVTLPLVARFLAVI